MNQRRWGLPLGGIKSSLEIVCFQVAPERVKCIGWTDRARKGIPNRWCSCTEGARTKNKVSARDLQEVRRKRWPENKRWTVRNKKTREIKWNFIVCGFESERGKFKFDTPLNVYMAFFVSCVYLSRVTLANQWNYVLKETYWVLWVDSTECIGCKRG